MESLTNLFFFDVDATGEMIYDELVSLAVCNQSEAKYSSFIMPSSDFSINAKYRLNLSISNFQNIRFMKDTKSKQAVSTKSLYIVMKKFLNWLKENNTEKKKIWLIYYGVTNLPALLLLKSLIRFKLYDEFTNEVEYIINLNDVSKTDVSSTLKTNDPKVVFSVLLNIEEKNINISRATLRLPYVFKLFNHLLTGMEQQDVTGRLSQHTTTMTSLSKQLDSEFATLEKRSSLDPIFKKLFSTFDTRAKYVKMRNQLVNQGISYDILKEKHAQNCLKEFIEESLESSEDTLKVIMAHFSKEKSQSQNQGDKASAPAATQNPASQNQTSNST